MGDKKQVLEDAIKLGSKVKNFFSFSSTPQNAVLSDLVKYKKTINQANFGINNGKTADAIASYKSVLSDTNAKMSRMSEIETSPENFTTIDKVMSYRDMRQQIAGESSNKERGMVSKVLTDIGTAKNLGSEYFLGGKKTAGKLRNAGRIGAAVGIYAGVNAGGRLVSGGSLTRNNKGEKDIAGIPFI